MDQRPVHRVRISKPFLLGRYPVTNAEYRRFLEANPGSAKPASWDSSQFNGPMQPVVGVSWREATARCAWAGYRLPTEAEWEYACRAGSESRFCSGDDEALLGDFAWWGKNRGGRTQPVGQKKANAWGLHDVHGNVWEWCADWYGRYREEFATDPGGPETGTYRVLRGGAWVFGVPAALSCSCRDFGPPDVRDGNLGFRCVWLEGLAR